MNSQPFCRDHRMCRAFTYRTLFQSLDSSSTAPNRCSLPPSKERSHGLDCLCIHHGTHHEELHVHLQNHDHLSCHLCLGHESYREHLYASGQPMEEKQSKQPAIQGKGKLSNLQVTSTKDTLVQDKSLSNETRLCELHVRIPA